MVGGKGFKSPFTNTGVDIYSLQSTRIQQMITKQSTLSDSDQFFWRVALDKNCPPTLKGRVDKIKSELTLSEVISLIEVLEIESALEEAFRRDEEIKAKAKENKGK